MKPSYYNLTAPAGDGGAVLFNTRSGCMAQLDREHYEAFQTFEANGKEPADEEFREGLLACGFAVKDRENELEAIRLGLLRSRFATETLSLAIALTQDCNFRCVYCYEKDQLRRQVLDGKAIGLLNDCKVTKAQVTLDGSRASHDSRRPLKGGGGSFDAILRNLKLCKDRYKGGIALRMNVDRNNLSEISEVKALLKEEGLDKTVILYLGHVTDENGTCAEGSCLGGCEFARKNLEFLLDQEDGGERFRNGVPRPITNCCGPGSTATGTARG